MSSFGQGLKDLGIGQIFALTPEAKGRIERLWNILQDRLTGELRLLDIKDIDGANKVLPKLIAKRDEKFAVLPAESENVYVKPVERIDMDFLFARRQTRKTDGGGSISYKGRTYAPRASEKGSMARTSVEVRETLSGKIWVVHKGQRIEMMEVQRPERAVPKKAEKDKKGKPVKRSGSPLNIDAMYSTDHCFTRRHKTIRIGVSSIRNLNGLRDHFFREISRDLLKETIDLGEQLPQTTGWPYQLRRRVKSRCRLGFHHTQDGAEKESIASRHVLPKGLRHILGTVVTGKGGKLLSHGLHILQLDLQT